MRKGMTLIILDIVFIMHFIKFNHIKTEIANDK